MISAVLIYGQRGEVLASRVYKDGLRRAVTDAFRVQVIANPENQTPLLTLGSTSFLHIRHKDLYVVAVTRQNVDAAMVYEFLYRLTEICTAHLGAFDEASCYRNVTRIYEIFDEIVDFGYPQVTELGVLKQFLSDGTPAVEALSSDVAIGGSGHPSSGFPSALNPLGPLGIRAGIRKASYDHHNEEASADGASSHVPWRRSDIKHRRNEVYVDIMESLQMVVEPSGKLVRVNIDGNVQVKAQLTGMPDCRLALTDADAPSATEAHEGEREHSGGPSGRLVHLEECQLHECVDHRRFQSSRTIAFLPPEGEFELMRYGVSRDITVPFFISNEILWEGPGTYTHHIQLRCLLESKQHAMGVVLNIPTIDTDPKGFKGSTGKAKYNPGESRVEWRIGRIGGKHEASLRLPLRRRPGAPDRMPPITLDFQLSMYTCSGIKVRYLKVVEDSRYATLKWVRYLTRAGACEVRVPPLP